MKYSRLAFVFALFTATTQAAVPYAANVSTNNAIPDIISAAPDCNNVANNPFTNCGFESGDFSGWVTQDLTNPFFPLSVQPAGVTPGAWGFFATAPTEGSLVAAHGFDGDGPGVITIGQDVSLPSDAANLVFDYRAAWNLIFGATLDRHLTVEIQPAGGGAPLRTTSPLLTLPANTTVLDTGNQTASVYIGDFAGQNVRLVISAEVPESFTGPAFIQFDNFSVSALQQVPALSQNTLWFLLMGMLVLAGLSLRKMHFRKS